MHEKKYGPLNPGEKIITFIMQATQGVNDKVLDQLESCGCERKHEITENRQDT